MVDNMNPFIGGGYIHDAPPVIPVMGVAPPISGLQNQNGLLCTCGKRLSESLGSGQRILTFDNRACIERKEEHIVTFWQLECGPSKPAIGYTHFDGLAHHTYWHRGPALVDFTQIITGYPDFI